jgi:hypothetical protein
VQRWKKTALNVLYTWRIYIRRVEQYVAILSNQKVAICSDIQQERVTHVESLRMLHQLYEYKWWLQQCIQVGCKNGKQEVHLDQYIDIMETIEEMLQRLFRVYNCKKTTGHLLCTDSVEHTRICNVIRSSVEDMSKQLTRKECELPKLKDNRSYISEDAQEYDANLWCSVPVNNDRSFVGSYSSSSSSSSRSVSSISNIRGSHIGSGGGSAFGKMGDEYLKKQSYEYLLARAMHMYHTLISYQRWLDFCTVFDQEEDAEEEKEKKEEEKEKKDEKDEKGKSGGEETMEMVVMKVTDMMRVVALLERVELFRKAVLGCMSLDWFSNPNVKYMDIVRFAPEDHFFTHGCTQVCVHFSFFFLTHSLLFVISQSHQLLVC